jgi:Protein of unknown function (DUF1579)
MRRSCAVCIVIAVGLMVWTPAAAQEMPPMPKPGPEHQLFKMDEGTWDAVVELNPGPGAPPMTSKGVETNTVGCGGLCLITDFKGEMMPGAVFQGHGVTAYDPAKKKYVGSWTDSMSAGVSTNEATYDAATKTATGSMEGPDASGKVVKSKSTVEYKDAEHRVFTMFTQGPDGKEVQTMRITYTRRK